MSTSEDYPNLSKAVAVELSQPNFQFLFMDKSITGSCKSLS